MAQIFQGRFFQPMPTSSEITVPPVRWRYPAAWPAAITEARRLDGGHFPIPRMVLTTRVARRFAFRLRPMIGGLPALATPSSTGSISRMLDFLVHQQDGRGHPVRREPVSGLFTK